MFFVLFDWILKLIGLRIENNLYELHLNIYKITLIKKYILSIDETKL